MNILIFVKMTIAPVPESYIKDANRYSEDACCMGVAWVCYVLRNT